MQQALVAFCSQEIASPLILATDSSSGQDTNVRGLMRLVHLGYMFMFAQTGMLLALCYLDLFDRKVVVLRGFGASVLCCPKHEISELI